MVSLLIARRSKNPALLLSSGREVLGPVGILLLVIERYCRIGLLGGDGPEYAGWCRQFVSGMRDGSWVG